MVEKTKSCHMGIGQFKISRAFQRALTFFFYNIYWSLYINWNSNASVAQVLHCKVQDLGSNPRSEQIPYYFSFTNPMRFSNVGVRYTITIQPHACLTKPNQRPRLLNTISAGQHAIQNPKKSTNSKSTGPELLGLNLTVWGYPPPGLHLFSIFLLTFYFYFIYFIILI